MLLVVDLPERLAAARAGLAEPPVDEVHVLVALPSLSQLERASEVLVDRGCEPLDLLVAELRGERERRELGAIEDLVGVGAADPGERPLVAEQRVEPSVVAGEDLAEPLDAEPQRFGPDVGELGLGLLR